MKTAYIYDTYIGKITIIQNNNKIIGLKFGSITDSLNIEETDILKLAGKQINEYLNGCRKSFDLPVQICGTAFQTAVWNALTSIPYGEVWSYKQVSEVINRPRAYRAVGLANKNNPIPIIIPCHRVIGVNGELIGYDGGLDIKRMLLRIEKENTDSK